MKPVLTAGIVLVVLMLSGCILRDELTTISVYPDGSANLVVFHSNIRSTEEGARGQEELERYAGDFAARRLDHFVRIEAAGGTVTDAHWLRKDAPYASVFVASLPAAEALEKFGSVEGGAGELRVATRFSQTGNRRRLAMRLSPPEGLKVPDDSTRTREEVLQEKANGFSETRIVVVDGRIVASKGWTVASDNRSALLCLDEIARLLRSGSAEIDLFIEWEVPVP